MMNSFLYTFALVLLFTLHCAISTQLPGSDSIDPSELDNDTLIQELMVFGARYCVERGIEAGDIPNSMYEITRLYGIDKQQAFATNVVYLYQFDLQLTNSERLIVELRFYIVTVPGGAIKEMEYYGFQLGTSLFEEISNEEELFELDFLPKQLDLQLNEFDFLSEELDLANNIENEELIEDEWAYLDPSDVDDNEEALALLNFGVEEILHEQVGMGNLAGGQYHISQIYSAKVIKYRSNSQVYVAEAIFEVELTNTAGPAVRIGFGSAASFMDGQLEIGSLSYHFYMNVTNDHSGFELEDDQIGEFNQVDISTLENDQMLENALGFGLVSIYEGGEMAHRLPNGPYNLIQINSIYINGPNKARFDVEIANDSEVIARVVFIVDTNTLELLSQYLRIISLPGGGLIKESNFQ